MACSFGRGRGRQCPMWYAAVSRRVAWACFLYLLGRTSSLTHIPTLFLGPSLLPLLQGVFRVGGSSGDSVTHVIHFLRETAGAGRSVSSRQKSSSHVRKTFAFVKLSSLSTARRSPLVLKLHTFQGRRTLTNLSKQTAPDAGLPSADEQFLATVR
ncbi:hypothetical protein EDB86DRAFT_572699 [Lactarius hatsudake]|nr:hypothetical protein EDB86DRAFT_572699 [Lactarius hatsudake]